MKGRRNAVMEEGEMEETREKERESGANTGTLTLSLNRKCPSGLVPKMIVLFVVAVFIVAAIAIVVAVCYLLL